MGLPTDTLSSYGAIGNREDLSDIIYEVAPTKTPFLSMLSRTTATSTKHEWQTHSLAAASATNFVLEGDDATTDAGTTTARVVNYTGISDKVARVTRTQEKVSKAGRNSEMAFQMETKMKELKRDCESILLANNAYVAGNDTTARESAGVQAWIKTNTDIASDATASTGDGSDAHTDGTARALTEFMFEEVLSSCWTEGGEPTMAILNKFQKRKVANFSGNTTRTMDGDMKKLTNTIDIYIDPLGNEIRMVPDQFVPADVIYFIDPEHVKFAVLDDFQSQDLSKTGDSDRKQIIVEATLEMCNEKAHGGIYDLAVS